MHVTTSHVDAAWVTFLRYSSPMKIARKGSPSRGFDFLIVSVAAYLSRTERKIRKTQLLSSVPCDGLSYKSSRTLLHTSMSVGDRHKLLRLTLNVKSEQKRDLGITDSWCHSVEKQNPNQNNSVVLVLLLHRVRDL